MIEAGSNVARTLYESARALGRAKRDAFLDTRCSSDAALRREVEALLRHDEELGDFLAEPIDFVWRGAFADESAGAPERSELLSAPDCVGRVGPFRVLAELGRGGMSIVYLAEQDRPRRRVALKLVRPERTEDASFRRRFETEVEALGRIEHPGIARLYQAGTAPAAHGEQPWFAMELVDGRSIVRYADEEQLGVEDRLALVADVADAVEHAHRSGVVHRDLKPANVLVGADRRPKVLDFGIARCTDADLQATLATSERSILGTLASMSPEQAAGDRARIDARTDVYALGVILYELLAGRLPTRVDGLPVHEAVRAIVEDDVERLGEVRRELAGDVETIVGKALEKDPERRYASAAALAEDLRRFLRHEPIAARPPSRVDRLRKLARRNRGLVVGLALFVGALVLGLFGTTRQALRANATARDLAVQKTQAEGLAEEARASAELAEMRTKELLRLADLRRQRELRERADALWPVLPEAVEAYEAWLHDARALLERLPEHRASLEALRARGANADDLSAEELDWWTETLEELVRELEAFSDPATGLVTGVSVAHGRGVERRLELARSLRESASDPLLAAAWEQATRSIAENSAYGGLVLARQADLVPLGPDPESGLWELAHVPSGTVPERDPETGRLTLAPDFGVVLVLVPGDTFRMGAQAFDETLFNYDPSARPGESPTHEVTLAPYFLSKYELTQQQWRHMTGANPSFWTGGRDAAGPVYRLPVERVSWREAGVVLARYGLALPTEAQWEHAARAGTATPWWTGAERETLAGRANLADRTLPPAGNATRWPAWKEWPDLDDGYWAEAPVGTFPPNPSGLHEILGNLAEICREAQSNYAKPVRAGDGERVHTGRGQTRMVRGGSYAGSAKELRSASRTMVDPDARLMSVGVRPSRTAEPAGD